MMGVMGLLKFVGGLLMTLFGMGFIGFGGQLPTMFGGTYMLMGFLMMVLGGFIMYKVWKMGEPKGELVGIGPEGEKYYK